jgi:hypothetical protein
VVPPGDEALWSHPPFAAEVADGIVYGRGACDMKGPLAAFAAAAIAFAQDQRPRFPARCRCSSPATRKARAVNGTAKVLGWLAEHDQVPDHCVVGEPTSTTALGDTVKIGRRGSMHFAVTATGTQGHTAYPHLADNPVPKLARLIDRLASEPGSMTGTEHFEPSTLAVTTFDVANPAHNVIPATARARFNIRFNSAPRGDSLKAWVKQHCERCARRSVAAFTVTASRECRLLPHRAGAAGRGRLFGGGAPHRARPAHHLRRHLGCPLRQGLLPGGRAWAHQRHHPPGRRAPRGWRTGGPDPHLPSGPGKLLRPVVVMIVNWLEEVRRSLIGSWLLLIRDTEGYRHFSQTEAGFWRSFSAIVIIAPLYLYAGTVHVELPNEPASPSRRPLAAAMVGLVLQWIGWPLAMVPVSRLAGLAHAYARYIIAYNWSSVLVVAVLMPPLMLLDLGLVGPGFAVT